MNDKYQELLNQYDLTIQSTFRSKGTFQCETDQGLAMLSEYRSSLRRLAQEYEWKEALYYGGFTRTDRYFVSKTDSLVVYDKYHTPFVLKHYFRGRECDCTSLPDIRAACSNLAFLHQISSRIPNPPSLFSTTESIKDLFLRRNRELKSIRRHISRVSRKKPFELLYIKHYQRFYDEACHALDALNKPGYLNTEPESGICHGAYHHHNILFLPDGSVATISFESICRQPYLMDLYLFLRKVLEKNHYDYSVFESGVDAYSQLRPVSIENRRFLYFLFLYPEKFWKISNRYYNSRKSWISPKMDEKLTALLMQDAKRQEFLKKFKEGL